MAEKILIVDDDFETISFLSLMLTRQGYQVVSAKSGAEGLNSARKERPDLVILDVMMPDMDGFEVARKLRGSPDTSAIPILMFTAKSQIGDKVAGYAAGVDFYLTKPVHPLELQANVKSLITHRRAQAPAPPSRRGYLIGVLAAKGGLGTSTLTLNLAVGFQQKHKMRVIAAELRPGQGTWGIELNLMQTEGLTNILCAETASIDSAFIDKQLLRTTYDVRLLLASNKSKDAELLGSVAQFEMLIDQIPELADLILLDIGTNQFPALAKALDACDEMILIVEPQPVTVKRTRLLLDELRQKGYGSAKVLTTVINNRARMDMSMSVTQLEEALGASIMAGLPPVPEQIYYAGQRSVPMLLVQPDGIIAQQYNTLADQISRRLPAS